VIPYRDFTYPLNVFMHILTREEGGVRYLHYGFFESDGESIDAAQERSTELLLSRLPSPPARLLDVGVGLGTTLDRLARLGYDAEGITPDDKQAAIARFEEWSGGPYDVLLFQESSQYIDSDALFAKARTLAPRVLVLDEFATRPGIMHMRDDFLRAAAANGFRAAEELDLSAKAAPTVDYFRRRLSRYRDALIADLGLTNEQVDHLIANGEIYSNHYHSGALVYRLLDLRR
jgi:hypothetical protein